MASCRQLLEEVGIGVESIPLLQAAARGVAASLASAH
jgi:hypothetical protein